MSRVRAPAPRALTRAGRPLASFCGTCSNCTRIADAADLDARVSEAVASREEMRDADKKDTRILIQTHPDVLIVPPDPPQNLIKVGQIRTLINRAHYIPTEAPARVFLLTTSAFMKEAANSLLKLLEEPPDRVHLILLAENPGELLPTLRSRCAVARLGTLPPEEIVALLAERRPDLKPAEAQLVARLAEGAAGRALSLDLPAYIAARADAFTLLASAEQSNDHSALFRMTETYRAGAEGQEKTLALLRAASGLLEDILMLQHNAPGRVRNIDRRADLQRLADTVSFEAAEKDPPGSGRDPYRHAPQPAPLPEPRRLRRESHIKFSSACGRSPPANVPCTDLAARLCITSNIPRQHRGHVPRQPHLAGRHGLRYWSAF